jgi:hypothetical protein
MRDIPVEVDTLNRNLINHYGRDNSTNLPNWRVVWSEDQFEQRYGEYEDRTPEGLLIRRFSGVREAPKYRQWVEEKWCLEALIPIPSINTQELPETKLSYELIYPFPHHNRIPLIPIWSAVRLVIEEVHRKTGAQGQGPFYKDPMSDPKIASELKEAKLKELEEDLYGNETDIGDALAYRQGTGFTTSKLKGNTGPSKIASPESEN